MEYEWTIIKQVLNFPDGSPRKRKVFEREGVIYRTLQAARIGKPRQWMQCKGDE